jgi:hypothetical protein
MGGHSLADSRHDSGEDNVVRNALLARAFK